MEIRELTEADAATYRAVRLRALQESPESFGSSYAEEVTRSLAHTAARLRKNAEGADKATLGAFKGEMLIGTVTILQQDGAKDRHKAIIVAMFVAPEERRSGVGRALIEAVIARARQMDGVEQLNLSVVTTELAARQLYRACGFEPYGVEPHALKQGDRYWDEELLVLRLPA